MIKKLLFFFFVAFSVLSNAQEDCVTAITVCGNSNINYTPAGIGNINENLGNCLSGEHHSVWYKFTIATSGTLTFNLVPTGPVDYDWAIYGPNKSCNNLGTAIRCNASGDFGSTGMTMTNTNTTSGAGNTDPYCKYMDVVAGQTYYLYLDNWSSTVYTFNLTWGGTATFVSPFTNPAISPNPFIPPGIPGTTTGAPREINICGSSTVYNFSTLTPGILNGNANFSVNYYSSANNAATGTNPILTPVTVNANATYYYTISYLDPANPNNSANACKQTNAIIFKDKSLTASITASSTVLCPNGNITLTSNSSTGNTWSTGATTQSITVTTPGNYTLTRTNGICTSPVASVNITQDTNPNVQITGNLFLCENSSTTLTATSNGTGNTYLWSTTATTPSINVTAPGTYTVTVKTPANCLYNQSVTVGQGVVPNIISTNFTTCSATSNALFDLILLQSQISSTPGLTFDFYLNQSDALAGNSATIPNPSTFTSTGGTIYVRIKSTTCAKVVAVNLSVTIKPVAQITASSMVICGNSSVTLTSNSATGNLWSTGATTQSITVSSPGIYTLTVSGNNTYCTSDAASINIFKDADPDVQISGALIFCQGTPTTLNATANGVGNSFLWSNGATTSSIDVNSAGTYTVTVTTVNGCTFTKSTVVTMDPAITININPPAQIDCSQAQITLNATSSVYQSGATFLWTTSGGNIVSGGNTLTPVVNNSGIYTLTITSPTLNGCSKQASVTVIKNNTPPAISVSASQLKICKGSSVTLTATGASTYNWTGLPGTGSSQTVSPTGTTTYTVTGTGANGCTASPVSITITVVPEISSTLQNIEICKGDKGILDAGAGPDYIYNWSTGATTRTITVTTEGNYSVTISNGVCSKTFTAVVNYITTPLIKEIIYSNPNLTIIAQNSGNLSLQYSIDGGVSWQNSNVFTVLKNTQYSIKVRNTGALCETSSEYYTFFMNNVITPNSDGKNDVIDFSEISRFSKFEGSIFDRYGKTVFKADSKNKVWNGTYIGRPLPTGTYWYKMTWEESITKKTIELTGWILLKNRD